MLLLIIDGLDWLAEAEAEAEEQLVSGQRDRG